MTLYPVSNVSTTLFSQNLREVVDGYYAYMEESKVAARRKTSASALNNACAAVAVAVTAGEDDDLGANEADDDRIKVRKTTVCPRQPSSCYSPHRLE